MLTFGVQRLVVMRGLDRAGTVELARALAAGLPGKSACIHFSDLRERWILHHGDDPVAESDMCYQLLKLTVVTYLKNGYSVVVDAPYVETEDGVRIREDDVNDLVRLSRTFRGIRPCVVTLLPAGGAEDPALASALEHSHLDSEIRVAGGGGNTSAFAVELLQQISTM